MDVAAILDFLNSLPGLVSGWVETLGQPWVLIQFGLMLLLFGVAHLAARLIGPKLEQRLRDLPQKRLSQLRLPLLLIRRLRPLMFILLAWLSVLVLQSATWLSRSYYVSAIASFVTVIVFVSIASRIIRNGLLRTIVTWAAWIFFTLSAIGIVDETFAVLDSAALTFGEVRLSLLLVIKAVVTVALLFAIASWISRLLVRRIETVEDISPSMRVLTTKLLRMGLFGAAILFGLYASGFDLTSITVLSGAIGLGIGFGLQKVASNLVSGLILLMDKSIKPGDVISLGETFGWIQTLGARYVSVLTRDGREFLVPNEDLITSQVVNWSYSNEDIRLDIYFGVSYDSDPHVVRRVAREAAATVKRVVTVTPPVCHIVGFGDSSIDLILRFWIRDPVNGLTNVRGDVYLAVWDAFKANGIQIPYPRRDVTILPGKDGPSENRTGADLT